MAVPFINNGGNLIKILQSAKGILSGVLNTAETHGYS